MTSCLTERERLSPLFMADWLDVVFIHFALDPEKLQPHVPLELDLKDGRAFVSLVAFTQRGLRPAAGGRLGALLARPLADHAFLNLRTYVRHDGDAGIYFIAEWIPNRLAVLIGPRTYGLPYRPGTLHYRHHSDRGRMAGKVRAAGRCLSYRAACERPRYEPASAGSLAEFLLERYSAYTHRRGVLRRFRIAHPPWRQVALDELALPERSLLDGAAEWLAGVRAMAAHYSPGLHDVRIGWPERLREALPC